MKTLSLIALILLLTISAFAQTTHPVSSSRFGVRRPIGALAKAVPGHRTPKRGKPDETEAYTLRRGDNEFGGWGGVSFKATTIFAGLSNAEAADRKFFLAAFRYGRTLAANDSMALQYTLDAVPVAVATGVITSRTTVGGVTTFQRDTSYGAGVSPIGFQVDFANGSKIHPFAHVNGGFLVFTTPVPIEDSGNFAFTLEGGGGVRVFTSARRAVTLGLRFHHISNGNRHGANRGLNQFVFYAGFSIFK